MLLKSRSLQQCKILRNAYLIKNFKILIIFLIIINFLKENTLKVIHVYCAEERICRNKKKKLEENFAGKYFYRHELTRIK